METYMRQGRCCHTLQNGAARIHIYWPVMPGEDLQKTETMLQETGAPFLITAFEVENWNDALSPWPAEPVFGEQGFAGGAYGTLEWIKDCVSEEKVLPRYVGGYSLGGLFALLCLYETDLFTGAVSGSGSFWYPGWAEYAASGKPHGERVLFSLGDREERSRNPDFARVGDTTRDLICKLKENGVYTELRMDRGGHFDHPTERMIKNFARLLELT